MSCSSPRFVVTIGVAVIASTSHAAIVNPSFEDDVLGWSMLGGDGFLTDWNGFGGTPHSGAGQAAARMEGAGGGWQTVALTAGDVILFDVAPAQPFGPGYGGGWFNLQVWLGPATSMYPENWDLNTPSQVNISWSEPTAPYGQWTTRSLIAPATGLYTLGFFGWAYSSFPTLDTRWVMIDNFRIVPGPGTGVMLIVVGLRPTRRRR
jgi:hypothetical protein